MDNLSAVDKNSDESIDNKATFIDPFIELGLLNDQIQQSSQQNTTI